MNTYISRAAAHYLAFFQRDSVQNRIYWALMVSFSLMLIAPLWTITYLPFGDLPDHAGQIQAILNFSDYKNDYRINWFTPYLVAYSICLLFGQVFSATTALKVTYTLAALAVPLATASLVRALNVNRFWVLPSFATAYSFSFFWGFFSFVVATPMVIAFFAFCVHYSRSRINFNFFVIAAAFSAALFFAHAMAWAFSMLIAVCIIYARNGIKDTKDKFIPFFVLLPVVMYWVSINGAGNASSVAFGGHIEHLLAKLGTEMDIAVNQFNERSDKHEHTLRAKEFLSFSIGRMPEGDYIALSLILLIWPLITGAALTRKWKQWLPFLGVVGIYMVFPYWIFDTAYVNTRFAAFLMPLSLFIFEANSDHNAVNRYGVASFVARFLLGVFVVFFVLLQNYSLLSSFRDNDRDFKTIMEKMDSNKVVLSLIFDHGSYLNITLPYMHFGSYYQAEKGGIVLANFSHDVGAHNVPLRFKGAPWSVPDSWRADQFNWWLHNGERYDYFLVRSHLLKDELFSDSGGSVTLAARKGDWLLYKNNKAH